MRRLQHASQRADAGAAQSRCFRARRVGSRSAPRQRCSRWEVDSGWMWCRSQRERIERKVEGEDSKERMRERIRRKGCRRVAAGTTENGGQLLSCQGDRQGNCLQNEGASNEGVRGQALPPRCGTWLVASGEHAIPLVSRPAMRQIGSLRGNSTLNLPPRAPATTAP
eukprot:363607-Chlamydomonas_euryale.AAC.6